MTHKWLGVRIEMETPHSRIIRDFVLPFIEDPEISSLIDDYLFHSEEDSFLFRVRVKERSNDEQVVRQIKEGMSKLGVEPKFHLGDNGDWRYLDILTR
jgi:hypothetical protein